MEINLSNETINTVYNSLRCSKQELKWQLKNEKVNPNKKEIIEHQLAEVEDALAVFEELIGAIE